MEIWKRIDSIEGFEDYKNYEISNHGRVRSLKFGKTKVLKPNLCSNGYLQAQFSINGKNKKVLIHRLVAFAFISNDNPIEKTEINHIDENKQNNMSNNLEWCTREYNMYYGTGLERRMKNVSKKIFCIELNQIFDSIHEAERQLGLANESISRCCNGIRKTCGGYHWSFIYISLL